MATTGDITIYQGQDVDLDFTMDPVEDISTWDITLTVRGVDVLVQIDATVTDGPNGEFTITVPRTATETLSPGYYDYDVWRTDTDTERPIRIGHLHLLDTARF